MSSSRPLSAVLAGLAMLSCNGDSGVKVYNSAPAATIMSPPSGSEVNEHEGVEFEGLVDDADEATENLRVGWSSDIDGILVEDDYPDVNGVVAFNTAQLSPGNHVITLSVVDSEAASGNDAIDLTVLDVPDAPTVIIAHPVAGETGTEGVLYAFIAQVSDEQDAPPDIVTTFETDVDGVFCETNADLIGEATCEYALSVGDHILTVTAVDTDGESASDQIFFQVLSGSEVDNDGDGYSELEGDCDDDNPAVNPAAAEIACTEIDEDCDGIIDEDSVCYDDDGDGYTELDGDCDDTLPTVYPGAKEVCDGLDNDCDGDIDEGTSCIDDDGDGYTELDGDCDDTNATTFPGAPEVADGVDNDCDGIEDEGTTAYDDDGDCFCEIAPCTGGVDPTCPSLDGDDCDDDEYDVNPDAEEICDFIDNDCNDGVDEADATDAAIWYLDLDGDGWGSSFSIVACFEPSGYSTYTGDCDDADLNSYPGAPELCDDRDNDCNKLIDDGVIFTFYRDYDGDGYGDPAAPIDDCSAPTGYVNNNDDCDDSNSDLNPTTRWYQDSDGDGYGNPGVALTQCSQPGGYVLDATDCNDASNYAYPGRTETCSDSIDNDCDGSINEAGASGCTNFYPDNDGDGYGSNSEPAQCLCAADGAYNTADHSDCYDFDTNVRPGQTSYFTAAHGGGGFDYNCDGTEQKQDTAIGGCHVEISWSSVCDESPAGWSGSAPSCGNNGNWIWDCYFEWDFSCEEDTYTQTMACR